MAAGPGMYGECGRDGGPGWECECDSEGAGMSVDADVDADADEAGADKLGLLSLFGAGAD